MAESIPVRGAETGGLVPGGEDSDAARVAIGGADRLPGLELTPEASPAAGDGAVTRAQLDRWAKTYGTEHRQLRRWIARGKLRNDPCPLDDAERMPAWVENNLDKIRSTLRETVADAAATARAARPVTVQAPPADPGAVSQGQNGMGEGGGGVSEGENKNSGVTTAKGDQPPAAGKVLPSLDLATVGGVEGESVEFFRTIFAAVKAQLHTAYLNGDDGEIRKLHARLKDAGESLRKHEKDAEQRAIRLDRYLDKSEVFNEVTEALTMLARLREHRVARVRAELADVPADLLERICRELDLVGRREEDVLRSLSTMKSDEDVSLRLAA